MRPFAALAGAFSRTPAAVRGAIWMVTSGACFALMTALVRQISQEVHPFEIAFFRYLFGFVALLPWMMGAGSSSFRTSRIVMHGGRALAGLGVVLCFFAAVSWMPMADATALSFTSPLFATAGAALFLGEIVGRRRWTAIAIGFVGAMVLLRPGIGVLSLPAVLALAAAAFIAAGALCVKSLSRTESATTIVLYQSLLISAMSLVPAALVWTMPSFAALAWLALLGIIATAGHQAYVRAFAATDATAVLPFDFSRLVFTALLAFALFAERPDAWTWIGGAVIFGAALYTARQEARQAKPMAPPH